MTPQKEKWGFRILAVTSLLLLMGGLIMSAGYTPSFPKEEYGGLAHKIMYLHVPFAIVSFAGFFLGFCGSVAHLSVGRDVYHDLSRASIEAGFLFSIGVIISGPLWARPVWGVWWSFEPRLNTFLIMFALYAGYFLVPPFLNRLELRDRFRSVLGVINFLTVPMVYLSVHMIDPAKQNHPTNPELTGSMTWTLRLNMLTFFLLLLCLGWIRYRTLRMERRIYRRKIGA